MTRPDLRAASPHAIDSGVFLLAAQLPDAPLADGEDAEWELTGATQVNSAWAVRHGGRDSWANDARELVEALRRKLGSESDRDRAEVAVQVVAFECGDDWVAAAASADDSAAGVPVAAISAAVVEAACDQDSDLPVLWPSRVAAGVADEWWGPDDRLSWPGDWWPLQRSDRIALTCSRNALGPIRVWYIASAVPLERPGEGGQHGSEDGDRLATLGDLLLTDGATMQVNAMAYYWLWSARQRHHLIRSHYNESAVAEERAVVDAHVRTASADSDMARLCEQVEPAVHRARQAATVAQRGLSEFVINQVKLDQARTRFERQLGRPSGGAWKFLEGDLWQQDSRRATIAGRCDRVRLIAGQLGAELEHLDRRSLNTSTRAQAEATRGQERAARSAAIATMVLTVVLGAAGVTQVSSDDHVRIGILLIVTALLGSASYNLTFRSEPNNAAHTGLTVAAWLGSAAGLIALSRSDTPWLWLAAVVAVVGNVANTIVLHHYRDGEPGRDGSALGPSVESL